MPSKFGKSASDTLASASILIASTLKLSNFIVFKSKFWPVMMSVRPYSVSPII